MNRTRFATLASLLLTGVATAHAGSFAYGNGGTPASAVALTATTTGSVTGYFLDSNAGDIDTIALLNRTTGVTSAFFFNNKMTPQGTIANFGNVTAGDQLVFELFDSSTGTTLFSDANNSDGIAHAYVTPFPGGPFNAGVYPAGEYVAFEDRLLNQGSDLDYNDNNFLFTNVGDGTNPVPTQTPEPGSLALLGTGALAAFGLLRRRVTPVR